jgi:hypothetical protein
VTGGGVSGSDMPSLPWTARPDVSSVEDTSLDALLAGSGLPAGADPELRPVADVLTALSAHPAGDELTGLAGARAEFRRHVVRPARAGQSPRRRPGALASRLGVKVGAATALAVMALGGAAAAAYAGVLPGSWQQFAHRTIGAPAYRAHHPSAGAGAAGSAVPHPSHPAHQTHPSGPSAGHPSVHHAGPPHHVRPPAARPFAHLGGPRAPVPRATPSIGPRGAAGARRGRYALLRPPRDAAVRRPLRGGE